MEFPPKFHEYYEAPCSVAVRKDGARLGNFINQLDVTKHDWSRIEINRAIAVVGFGSDEGVYRNMGRRGAKEGPAAVRKVLYPLAWHDEWCCALHDFGDIVVEEGGNLLEGQRMLSHLVSVLQGHGIITMVIGGGHETAIGHYLGLERVHDDLSIINFDAHFDLRELERRGGNVDGDENAHGDAYNIDIDTAAHDDEYGGTSGTPFRQVARHCQKHGNPFRYSVVGIQEQANIPSLFEAAAAFNVRYVLAETVHQGNGGIAYGGDGAVPAAAAVHAVLDSAVMAAKNVYMTVCLDVFNSAEAPGVSAPGGALGLCYVTQVCPMLRRILCSGGSDGNGGVMAIDVVECCPPHDTSDQRTAKLAALIVYECIRLLNGRWAQPVSG